MTFFDKKRTREQEQALAGIDMLLEAVGILNIALEKTDNAQAHEAVTVLLTQCITTYGLDHPDMQQFLPVLDMIKRRIDSMEFDAALRQSKLFEEQLDEVKEIVLGTN